MVEIIVLISEVIVPISEGSYKYLIKVKVLGTEQRRPKKNVCNTVMIIFVSSLQL